MSHTAGKKRWDNLNGFVDVTLATLTPAEVRVWLVLFRDTKRDGTVRTGQTDIARRSGLSVRSVKTAVRKLTGRGILRVLTRGGIHTGPSRYGIRGVNPDAIWAEGEPE